jgi:glycosyltransferase involved in cell wall biosynthesis
VPLVSVLLAVHNGDRFLAPAIESVLRQTLRDLELIVVDDASDDRTPETLAGVGDRRLVVLRNESRLGLAASLNRGLDRADGPYVARLDADDLAMPNRLERQLSRVGDVDVLGTAVLDLDEQGVVGTLHRNPESSRAVRWLSLFSSPFFHPTVLVARAALGDLRYDSSFLESEDYELWTRLLERAEGVNLAEPLVLKREHAAQASRRRSDLQRSFARDVALREIGKVAPELSQNDAERALAREPEAYDALLAAFERIYGADKEVRDIAARTLGRPRPRLVLRRAQRLLDQRHARPEARSWLAAIEAHAPIRVVVVSPEPTPYRAPLFDLIAARPELDLSVVYAATTVAGRTWEVAVSHRALFLTGPSFPLGRRVLRHDYPLTLGIARALREARPDVVVVSGWSTFAAQAAIAWCRARRIPYVLLVESHDLGPRAGWRRMVKGTVVPRIVRGARNVLVVGSAARASVVERGADPERVRVFANTIDVPRWIQRAERLQPGRHDGTVVLSVGRDVPEKGFDVLARACAEAGVRLETITGGFGEAELAQRYVDADVFALLSRQETWGVVVNEAAASGLPLVLSDRVGAAHDLLHDGENGFLVPADDAGAAADALRRLAGDPELRRRMGARSREIVRAWGYEPSVENFVAAVREATSR